MRTFARARSGFTLIEMLLAIGIFILLVGAVYSVVSVAVTSSSQLAEDQVEARRLGAFQDFLRRGFLNLPAESDVSLRARAQGPIGAGLELVIKPVAGAFDLGPVGGLGGGVVLSVVTEGQNKGRFSIAHFPARMDRDELKRYLESATWVSLLDNVDQIRWRFWDKNLNQFVETWDKGRERPEMIEFTFAAAGESPTVCLFRLPTLGQSAPAP